MISLTANELKRGGVTAIKEAEADYAAGRYDMVEDFDKLAEELKQSTK